MLSKARKKVVVYGFRDTFCGQIVNSSQFKSEFEIAKVLTEKLPNIDEVEFHKRNPVKTCEYVKGNTIFGAGILEGESAWEYLQKIRQGEDDAKNIFGIFILEDNLCERKNIRENKSRYWRKTKNINLDIRNSDRG